MRTGVESPKLPGSNLTYSSFIPEYGMYHHNQSAHSHLTMEEETQLSIQAQALSLAQLSSRGEGSSHDTSTKYLTPVAAGLAGLVCGVALAVFVMGRRAWAAAAPRGAGATPAATAAADIL